MQDIANIQLIYFFLLGIVFGLIIAAAIFEIDIEQKRKKRKLIYMAYEKGIADKSCFMLTKQVSKGLYVSETFYGKEADGAYKLAKYFKKYYQEINGEENEKCQ